MADEDDPPPSKLEPFSARGCAWLFGGFFVSGLLGAGLTGVALRNNAPQALVPVFFLGPPLLFLAVFGAVAIPRVLRRIREMQRNAPSPESAAAVAAGEGVQAGTRPARAEPDIPADGLPAVPVIETKPGTTLAHGLQRVGVAPGCQFGCAVAVAAFWNGIVGVFVYQLLAKWNRGQPVKWIEALFLVPFVLVGLAIIAFALIAGMQWFVSLLVGRVEVELSDHPLTPGGRARVHVSQAGLFRLARVTVELVCTEEATYVAGTSKSTASREVAAHPISDPDRSPDGGWLPLTAEFTVPADAMHSFDAPNNEINWTVRVAGRVLGVLPFGDVYGTCVVPAGEEAP